MKVNLKWCRPTNPRKERELENMKELISLDFISFVLIHFFIKFFNIFENLS